jgi:hypothetical protein
VITEKHIRELHANWLILFSGLWQVRPMAEFGSWLFLNNVSRSVLIIIISII